MKMCKIIFNFRIFPSWERNNFGVILQSIIVMIGVLAFILTLSDFFKYFSNLKATFLKNNIPESNINSIFSKILLYNIFFDYTHQNFNFKFKEYLIKPKLKFKSEYSNVYYMTNTAYDYYTEEDNLIFLEISKLLTPIFVIAIFYLFRVKLI